MSDFTTYREVVPYLSYSGFRNAGSAGKCGSLFLGFERDVSGRSILRKLDRRAPLIVQQALYFDEELPDMPCVYILSAGGPNVDGDRYRQHFHLAPGSMAFISTGAATKLAEMRCNFSGLRQRFELEDGAYLEYLPEPLIPCRHTRFVADTTAVVASTATLVYSEIYTAGRRYYGEGECFAYDVLSVCTRAERPDGTPLFREKMIIDPSGYAPQRLGVMADYEVFANVLVLTPPATRDAVWEQTDVFADEDRGMAAAIARLPNEAGLLYKVLGRDVGAIKREVRKFCSSVRQVVKGHPLPEEFPWR